MAKDKGKKKNKKKKQEQELAAEQPQVQASEAPGESKANLSNKEFEKALEPLQVELVKMQQWVVATGAKVIQPARAA
jgi:polyphosphate kinase 2 (PPK2 family)